MEDLLDLILYICIYIRLVALGVFVNRKCPYILIDIVLVTTVEKRVGKQGPSFNNVKPSSDIISKLNHHITIIASNFWNFDL